MIRLFDFRDLPLVHKLRDHYISFHAETALTSEVHMFRNALAGMFVERDSPTFVWKEENNEAVGIARVHLREGNEIAQLLIGGALPAGNNGSMPPAATDLWLPFLDELVHELGKRGVHSIVVEVSETSDELIFLRRSGFAVYTRQDIWALESGEEPPNGNILRPRQAEDDWDINLLYANTVPRLIQLVEPTPPLQDGLGWVMWEDGELAAFVQRYDGIAGSWLRLFIHPGAHTSADQIAKAALQLKAPTPERPLFCCVPRYQSWLQSPLQTLGFKLIDSQAVMVKHTVSRVQKGAPERAAMTPAKQVARTTPYIQNQERPNKRRQKKAMPV